MPAPKWNKPLRPIIGVPGFDDKVKGLMSNGISNPGTTGPMYEDVNKPAVQPKPKVGPRPIIGFGAGPTSISVASVGAGFDLLYGASMKEHRGSGGSGSGRIGGKKLKI